MFAVLTDSSLSIGKLNHASLAYLKQTPRGVINSIIDSIEYDAATRSKRRREGFFSSKRGQASAFALNGWALALFGYQREHISEVARIGIVPICGPLPLLWHIAGIWILRTNPIDRTYYEMMIAKRNESWTDQYSHSINHVFHGLSTTSAA